MAELNPDREEFNHLKYPPFVLDLHKVPRLAGAIFASTASARGNR